MEEACGCTFRWHQPADFLVWPQRTERDRDGDLSAARPFDVRATVSPPRWCMRGQGTLQPEPRPLCVSVRSLCLQMDRRLPEKVIFDARDSVELLDQSLDHAVGMEQQQRRKPRRGRGSPSPRAAKTRTRTATQRGRGGDASERLHGLHAESQRRLARKAAAEAGEMFSPRTNHSASPRSPASRHAPSTPPTAASPRRRVSADQARRTTDKLYRQAQAKQADLKERQRQKLAQETKGLFTPRTTAQDRRANAVSTAEAYERQMLAGERLHEEACATQDRRRLQRVVKEQQTAKECPFVPHFEHFHGSGTISHLRGRSKSAETHDVGDRLHEWAVRKQEKHEELRRREEAQLRSQQVCSAVSAEQQQLAGERLYENACATQQRRKQEELAAKSTFTPDLVQFHGVQVRPSPLAKSEGIDEMRDVGDRLYAAAQQQRKEMDEKRQEQEEKMLEEVAQMGKPTISKKAQALERGVDEYPHYLKGTAISERRRPPDATGLQTSERREADADPGSWIEVEAAQQRRLKAAEATMHRLHALEWQRCKRETAKQEQSVFIEELRQKVGEEIVAKQRMAQVGVRKVAIGRLRPKIEPLLADHAAEPPLEWDELEAMILQLLSVYMRLTEVCEPQQLDEPRTVLGHEWCRAVDENGNPVNAEDASTVAMIDASLLDGALGNPASFFAELVGNRDSLVLPETTFLRRRSSQFAREDTSTVEERLFQWAKEKEAEKTKKAAEALVQQISDLATKQKFQGKPTLAFATQHTEASVGKDKCAFVVERKGGGQKSTVMRFEAGYNLEGVKAVRQKEAEAEEKYARTCRKKATPALQQSFSRWMDGDGGKEGIDKHGRKIAKELKAAIETPNPLAFSFRVDHPLDGSFLTDRSPSFRCLPKPATDTTTTHTPKPTKSSTARAEDLHAQATSSGLGFVMEAVPPPSRRDETEIMTPERKRQLEASWKPAGDQLDASHTRAQLMKEQAAAAKKRAGNAADNNLDAQLAQAAAEGAGSAHREATRIAAAHSDAAHEQAANIAEARHRFAVRKELADQLTVPEALAAARLNPAVIHEDSAGQQLDEDVRADVRAWARLEARVAEHELVAESAASGEAVANAEVPTSAGTAAEEDLLTDTDAAARDTERQHDSKHLQESDDNQLQHADETQHEHSGANADAAVADDPVTATAEEPAEGKEAPATKDKAKITEASKVAANEEQSTVSSGFEELENALQSWGAPSATNELEKELEGLLGAGSDSGSDESSSDEDDSITDLLARASDTSTYDGDALSIRRSKPKAPPVAVGKEEKHGDSEQEDEDDDLSCLEAALAEEDDAKAEAARHTSVATILEVTCPDGSGVGDIILIEGPDGEDIEVEVPDGITPGDSFEFDLAAGTRKTESMAVECPGGSAAGDILEVLSSRGETIEVMVPDGVQPGDTFEFVVPA